jgi:uncharacterized membrane protein
MDTKASFVPGPSGNPAPQTGSALEALRRAWHSIRARILGGLVLVLPIVITLWVVYWLYSTLASYVIDPLARLVLWKVRWSEPDAKLPFWFETYAAPLIAIIIALLLLYGLGFFVKSRLRRLMDWILLRLPVISVVYSGVQKVFQTIEGQGGQQRPQRVVLVAFPHPGMRVPSFVTGTCRDVETQKVILCVYVPTTPVPTSGYFLLVPEEETTELNWSMEQTLQTIVSGGLTAPSEVRYYTSRSAIGTTQVTAHLPSNVPPQLPADGQAPWP